MMKRGREEGSNVSSSIEESINTSSLELMANCLVQISKEPLVTRMFECKTCGRVFNSFQALGGHRASHHKKSKVFIISKDEEKMNSFEPVYKAKTVHECSICGMKFPLGQALGGHMRRHRVDDHQQKRSEVVIMSSDEHEDVTKLVPVLMRSLSMNKRVMCMDLNLTPLENDLQLLFGKKAPKVDCKLVV